MWIRACLDRASSHLLVFGLLGKLLSTGPYNWHLETPGFCFRQDARDSILGRILLLEGKPHAAHEEMEKEPKGFWRDVERAFEWLERARDDSDSGLCELLSSRFSMLYMKMRAGVSL